MTRIRIALALTTLLLMASSLAALLAPMPESGPCY
jgi:hypothetical protein